MRPTTWSTRSPTLSPRRSLRPSSPFHSQQQFFRSGVTSSFGLPFCVLLVDSVPRRIFGKISETCIGEDLHSFCLAIGRRARNPPFSASSAPAQLPVSSSLVDVVPHMIIRSPRLRPEKLCSVMQKDFCSTICQGRTSLPGCRANSDVRSGLGTPGSPPVLMEFLYFEWLIHIVFICDLPALLVGASS
jgi:hypothetical protein